jgi:hypothetical protein
MPENHQFDSYWAKSEPLQLTSELMEKISLFDRHIDMSGRWINARDLYYNYYLVNESNYTFPNYGADGFKRLNINHFRAILKHMLSLVTAQRAAPEPIATNSDYKSQAQTSFCKNILRYVEKEKKLEKIYENATEAAIVLGSAYVSREWDATLGEVYNVDPATGAPMHKGDFVVSMHHWIDVIFDYALGSYDDSEWTIIRKYVNRWDLIARFPAQADQIKSMSITPETKRHRLGHILNEQNDDLIPLYTFYHKKSAALPDGRATLFLDENICLFDGALPYKRIPLGRIAADDQFNTPFSYSVSMDLLPVQKVYNALCSVVCTNQAAFGVQNVLLPREANVSLAQLSEGLNAIYYDPAMTQGAKPEALNLLSNKQEVFNWIEYLEKKMASISGINDTIQGNPTANLKSGTALAFVASQALTFLSPLSRSYNSLLEDTWTGIIDILKEFATTPRLVLISGLSNRSQAKEFTNSDIADIDRVIVEAANPLTQTLAGRIQIAQDLIQAGLLNKEEYITVVTTGQLEPLYAYEKSELLTIKRENEDLQDGKKAIALTTDNHPLHIREHLTLLSDPAVRNDPNNPVVVNTLAHIMQDHIPMWQNLTQNNPVLLAVQNIPPCPMPPQPPQPEQPKISQSISYKDLPPEGRIQMAANAGIQLGQPTGNSVESPNSPIPGNPGQATPPAAHDAVPQASENPTGSKVAGAPNLPGVLNATNQARQQAGGIQDPNAPKLPQGSPAVTQEAYAKLHAAMPQQPPLR